MKKMCKLLFSSLLKKMQGLTKKMLNDCNTEENLSFEDYYQNIMRQKYREDEKFKDLLNRSRDISDICRLVRQKASDKDYFSLAITGEWGSGKSFVLKQVEEKLKGEFLTIHFDCWENDFYDEPLYGIIYSLVQYFNNDENPDFAQSKYYEAMRKIIFGIVKLTPLVNVISKDVISVVSETIADVKKINKKEQIDSNLEPLQKDIHSTLDKICAAFATYISLEKKKIIVAVDELDRCLPDYALKVLNRLHHICYGASIILITAVNQKELYGCINTAFGKVPDDVFSNRYLDRFFDYAYILPNGNTSDLLCLWNGLDSFDESVVSKEFLRDFCNELLKNFSMREKKKVISNVCSFHKIINQDNHDKLTYAVLCAELMFAVKYFYLNNYYWDYIVGPFDSGPYDEEVRDEFDNPQPKENVFTLYLSKPIDDSGRKDKKIELQILVTEYDDSLPCCDIPVDSAANRLKALFAEPYIPDLNDRGFFVCNCKDPLFEKEVEVFSKFKKVLQQIHY